MWLREILDTVNGYSGLLSALFAMGLVFATVGLWRATTKYKEATKRYADIAHKGLILQQMGLVEGLYTNVYNSDMLDIVRKEAVGEALAKEEQEEIIGQWKKFYRGLVNQMREDLAKEFTSSSGKSP